MWGCEMSFRRPMGLALAADRCTMQDMVGYAVAATDCHVETLLCRLAFESNIMDALDIEPSIWVCGARRMT